MATRHIKRTPRFLRDARRRSAYNSAGLAGGAAWPGSLATPTVSGLTVTPLTALSYSAYCAGVHVISEDVSSLPIAVFRRKPRGGAKLVRDHPITRHFNRCPAGQSKEMPSLQWREAWVGHCLGWGNGYAEIDWTRGGDFNGLNLLNPGGTVPKRDDDGSLYYDASSGRNLMRYERPERLPPYKVLHLAWMSFNGLVGYSPVGLMREAIGLGKASEQFGASLFGNGAVPKGFLKYPGKLKAEAKANLRDSFNAIHQGSANANKIAVLEEGMDWVNTQINPDDAQFLLTRQFQVVEICRLLRLPPHKIADYSQAHLANVEAANLDYLMTCLRPWCVRIEQCLDLKLLTDEEVSAGFYTRHDLRALLRASIKDRSEYYKTMFMLGMSPDEIRELEDMNPIGEDDGGSRRFRPANLIGLNDGPGEADASAPDASLSPGQTAGFSGGPNGPFLARENGLFSHVNGGI